MHRIGLAVAVACMLCACASVDPKETAVSSARTAKCDTSNLDWAKGQPANEENARRLVRESGLGLWRIIGPDNVERADYRPDRLTIYTDKDNVIQSLDCH